MNLLCTIGLHFWKIVTEQAQTEKSYDSYHAGNMTHWDGRVTGVEKTIRTIEQECTSCGVRRQKKEVAVCYFEE
jgi:hypothetical protein